jgi:recombinational DNA repair ATPase RecF
MRKAILSMLAIAGILAACHSIDNSLREFIPGTYVNQAQSEFSVANDTLVITQAKSTDNIYLITRKTGYRRITDGKMQELQHQVKRLTGEWDSQKQMIQIMQTGNTLIFQPEKNNLLNGSSEYRKL